jgi:LysR family glycine cleavage system transcriptional activator
MPQSLPPLTALRAFEAAARHSSFSRAARELHVTPAAVSHQIRGLEKYLDVTLFHRVGKSLVLTEQGHTAAAQFREGFEHLADGVALLRGDDDRGRVTLSVTTAFASRWLLPRLGRFLRRFPSIDLRLRSGSQPVDFDQDDVDIAIRIGRGGVSGARAIPLFAERVVPVVKPAFARQHRVRRPADLARVPLLHDDSMRTVGRPPGWSDWMSRAGLREVDTSRGLHFDDGHTVLQAAAAGHGIALGRLGYAVGDLEAKRLRVPFGPMLDMGVRYYLLFPETRRMSPAAASFRSWLEQESVSFTARLQSMAGNAAVPAAMTEHRGSRR